MVYYVLVFEGSSHDGMFVANADGTPTLFRDHSAASLWFRANLDNFNYHFGPNTRRRLEHGWPSTPQPVRDLGHARNFVRDHRLYPCRMQAGINPPSDILDCAPGVH